MDQELTLEAALWLIVGLMVGWIIGQILGLLVWDWWDRRKHNKRMKELFK